MSKISHDGITYRRGWFADHAGFFLDFYVKFTGYGGIICLEMLLAKAEGNCRDPCPLVAG